ncbi:NACHT domain-containing protein [Streptomyces luteireticuli]|uniref:NACHT domain-containing protein n=1 Tax=Streptomyces luteireticuli TaxID=173858 RepID=A0ABP3HZK0_9ACTN
MTAAERVVAVLGARQGSGVLLTPKLVLTSAHLLGDITYAIAPGNTEPTSCDVLWHGTDACDAALVRARRPLVAEDEPAPLRWGVLATREPISGCQVLGFPDVARRTGELDIAQVPGTLVPSAARLRGRYVLRTDHHPPAPLTNGESPWAGLSGGPVFAGPLLVGIVAEDARGWQHSAIEAVPLFRILGAPGMTAALEKNWPDAPAAVTLHSPHVGDFAHEERYAKAIKARYGQLEVFGLDDLGEHEKRWDLDTAYLSLEGESARERTGPQRVEDLLSTRPRAVLRGEAGAGKTTLVWWLASHTACQSLPEQLSALNGLVPFVVPMRRLAAQGITSPSPSQLPTLAGLLEDDPPDGWTGRVLDAGRALLLVDGLDELPRADRAPARAWLDELLRRYPKTRCLVTVRPRAVEDDWLDWQGFEELRLLPMSDADIEAFVKAWHDAVRLRYADVGNLEQELTQEFRRNGTLRDLARTPLLCAVICALHRRRSGLLPHTRWSLYRAALAMLLGQRDAHRRVGAPEGIDIEAEDAQQLLQRIAIWLVRNDQTELTRKQATRQLELAMHGLRRVRRYTAGALMDHLLNRSGLLQERATDSIQFIHRTFQDYLAAKEFQDSDSLHELLAHAPEEQWRDVIRLVIGHCNRGGVRHVVKELITLGDAAGNRGTSWALRTLAAECAASAAALDDDVHDTAWERLGELGAPLRKREVDQLSSLGPDVLRVVPEPDSLDDEAARGYVRVLRTLGEAAIPHLRRYGQLSAKWVRMEIAAAWATMSSSRFAEEVLAQMRLDDIWVSFSRPEDLERLPSLGPVGRVQFFGDYGVAELCTALKGRSVRGLALSGNSHLTDLKFLHAYHQGLDALTLASCSALSDISALSGLNLTQVELLAHRLPHTALRVLSDLRNLHYLGLAPHEELGVEAQLPGPLPQVSVLVISGTGRFRLHGIGSWTGLVSLNVQSTLADPEPLGELRRLPRLTHLSLREDAYDDLTDAEPLPGITTASLTFHRPELAMPVHRLFPGLRELYVLDRTPQSAGGLGLRALHEVPGLRVTVERVGTHPVVMDADRFGDRLTTTVVAPE